jgi:hypothetical protein
MIAAKIAKPVPVAASPAVRPTAHPIKGPHSPLLQSLRGR